MDEESELIVIDDTKVLSELTRKIDEEPDDSAKDLRVVSQDKVSISEWCDDLKKVLLRQPLVQHVNFNANLVTRETVHGMGTRSTTQNVMPGICFELILMNREGKSSGVNRLVRQKQGLRLMANDDTHVFDEMSARVDFCFNRVKKITGNCTRLQGFSMFNAMGCGIESRLYLIKLILNYGHWRSPLNLVSRDKLIQYHKKRAIGEDFRDEVFYTNRYLCKITSFNVEKEIKRYYFEGMDIRDKLIVTMFDGLDERCQKKFGVVGEQYPFKTWKHKSKILRFISGDGIQILKNDDMKTDPLENLNMEAERKLDQLILGKYDIENYILHYYALTVRFFYAMPCHSNSCDVLVRGEKIISETHETEVSRGQARIREVLFAENIAKLHANKVRVQEFEANLTAWGTIYKQIEITGICILTLEQTETKQEISEMASKDIATHRAGTEIYYGATLCKQKAQELLDKFRLPKTFMPFNNLVEVGFNPTTGFIWLKQQKPTKYRVKDIGVSSYAIEMTGFLEDRRMRKLTESRHYGLFQ
ncbi:hypothetical protein V6N13_026398 [Hibiscus sabdariffa]